MKHWIRFLPEVGNPILQRAEDIDNLKAQIARLTVALELAEAEALKAVREHWTAKDIRDAKRLAKQDAEADERVRAIKAGEITEGPAGLAAMLPKVG